MSSDLDPDLPPIKELTRFQRRVLGVLVEKGITTPEVYPLTLKAAVSGCNQKSNRDPVVNYEEDQIEQVLDQLRELGLVAEVHTESGRTSRYRHYVRKRFPINERQLAIMTELMLRGQQSIGDLRSRASRMAEIESLDLLRAELEGLLKLDLIRSDAPLDRRGVEIDHNLYPASEKQPLRARAVLDEGPAVPAAYATPAPPAIHPVSSSDNSAKVAALEASCTEMRHEIATLRTLVESLRDDLRKVSGELHELRKSLGG